MHFPFLTFFSFFFLFSSAQVVSNVVSHQDQSNIIVSYNLETVSPCNISLYVSYNGGNTWTGPLKNVKGDVGAKINSGERRIFWSVLEEYNEFRGDNIKFQVRAEIIRIVEIKTKNIGKKEWAINNLDVISYRNGDIIPEVQDKEEWSKLTTGAWCYYENKTENGVKYGKLYNWYAVNDSRGLAPLGYHIASSSEWTKLSNYLGPESGKKLKSIRGWTNGGSGTNESGFEGLPGGYRDSTGTFYVLGTLAYWWSSTEKNILNAWNQVLYSMLSDLWQTHGSKTNGYSVRCLRD